MLLTLFVLAIIEVGVHKVQVAKHEPHKYAFVSYACILVRTIFPDPSCEDTLLHGSYPNDTGAFIN